MDSIPGNVNELYNIQFKILPSVTIKSRVTIPIKVKCIPFLRNSRDSQSDVMLRIVIETGLLHHEKQECYSLENARNIIKRAFNIIVSEKRTRIWSKFPAGSCLFSRLFSKLLESPPSASIKLHET